MKKYQLSTHIVLYMMLNVILAENVQALQGMATPKLHVEGRFLKDPSGKNVVLHGWMNPTASWFSGGGRWYRDPSDWTNPNDVAGFLNFMNNTATLMSDGATPRYGREHGWYCSFVRVNTDSIGGWTSQSGLVDPVQFDAWIENFIVPYAEHLKSCGLYLVLSATGPVVVNVDNDGGRNASIGTQSRLLTFWETFANAPGVKNADNIMFELMNEPVYIESSPGNGDWGFQRAKYFEAFTNWMQPVIDIIRNTGAENVIWVPTLEWQGSPHQWAQYPFTGTNIGVASHYYPAYGGVRDDAAAVQRLWDNQYKPAADRWPMIITEMSWFETEDEWSLVYGHTDGFGNAVRQAIDNQGNVSYLVGFLGDLLHDLNSDLPVNCSLSSNECAQDFFDWLPDYIIDGPTDRPMGLNATVITENQINLSWTGVPEAASYNIKRSTVSSGPYSVISSDITGLSFSDTDISSGQPYYYVVSANLSHGESPDSNESMSTGLQSYLNFDESEGTTAYDSTGNSWDGTLANGPQWDTGIFGSAVELDGSDDYISLPSGAVGDLTDFTISTWVYLDTISNWSRVFDFGSGTNVNMFLTPRNSITGAVRFAITNNGSGGEQRITGSEVLPTGAWTHVAVSLRGSAGVLYVNGSEVGRNSAMTLTPSSLGITNQNYIGRSQYPDPYLDGLVDDFRIYSVGLSGGQVENLYNTELPAFIPLSPTGLSATAVSSSQINLVWDEVPEATNYNIKYSLTDGGPYTQLASIGGTVYSDTNLPESTGYYYVVTALNSAGESLNSEQADAVTLNMQPQAPTGLAATDGNGLVSLNWQVNTDHDLAGYNVYRSTTSNGGYILLNESLLETASYIDSSAIDYNLYYYVVTAVDELGLESLYSEEVELLPIDSFDVVLNEIDFESGLGQWVNVTGVDTHDWTRDSGGTATPNTGPNTGANDSDWYIYIETSPIGAGKSGNTAIFESQDINGYNRVLIFDYHMFGVNIGSLNVDVYDGIWHEAVWSQSGQQQSSGIDNYKQALVDLRQYSGPVKIRFRAVAAGGSQGDTAIDNIEVLGRELYGDMNGDSSVNMQDLTSFVSSWIGTDCELDLDGDCLITLHEFAEFAQNWLNENSN